MLRDNYSHPLLIEKENEAKKGELTKANTESRFVPRL